MLRNAKSVVSSEGPRWFMGCGEAAARRWDEVRAHQTVGSVLDARCPNQRPTRRRKPLNGRFHRTRAPSCEPAEPINLHCGPCLPPPALPATRLYGVHNLQYPKGGE